MNIIQIPFHGECIPLIETADGTAYVQMKPVCENLGIDWSGQLRRLKKETHLRCGQMSIPTNQGTQEVTCIPANRLAAWLMGVSSWSPEVNRKLDLYKEEAADALDAHFRRKDTAPPLLIPPEMTLIPKDRLIELLESRLAFLEGKRRPKRSPSQAISDGDIAAWRRMKAEGISTKEIARRVGRSAGTVSHYMKTGG